MKNEQILAPGSQSGSLSLDGFNPANDEWSCVCFCGLHVKVPTWAILEGAGSCVEVSRKVAE